MVRDLLEEEDLGGGCYLYCHWTMRYCPKEEVSLYVTASLLLY
jgi:hypothetical protein